MTQLYFESHFAYPLFCGYIVLWLMIFAGNSLTMLAVWKYKNLQTKANILVSSLSGADTFVGVFSIFYDLCRIFKLTDIKNPSNGFIFLFQLQNASFICSLVHLVAIATDRYICIVYPLRYEDFMTDIRLKVLTACLWIIPYGFCLVPVPFAIIGIFNILDLTILFLPLHVIGACVISFIYIRIFKESKKQAFLINQQISSVSESVKTDMKKKQKSAKILGLLTLAYIITWVPLVLFHVLTNTLSTDRTASGPEIGFEICNLLLLSNSAINAYIYSWKNSKFRHAYHQLLKCQSTNSIHAASQEP